MADQGSIGVSHGFGASRLPLNSITQGIYVKGNGSYLIGGNKPVVSRVIELWRPYPVITTGNPIASQIFIKPNPGIIAGYLTTAGAIDKNYIVRLYWRPNGMLLDQVYSDINGNFQFNCPIDRNETKNYMVVGLDATGTCNAVVYDMIDVILP